MDWEVEQLDPADDAAMAAAHGVLVAAGAVDVPDFPPLCPYAFQGELTQQIGGSRKERFLARSPDRTVAGVLSLEIPLRDNLDSVEAGLVVHPEYRRRGAGRVLYERLLARMRELGRRSVWAEAVQSLPDGPARVGAGAAFAAAVGAKPALTELRSRLELPAVDEHTLTELAEQARVRADGYQIVTWRDKTPADYLADAAYLAGRLSTDAPVGDLNWGAEQVDGDRVREQERALAAARWHLYSTGAVHLASGRLVAVTTLARQHTSPWHAFQWITLVEPAHRGHRLGALIKVSNLRHARMHEPELQVIDTWNAESNAYMRAINTALGFRPVDSWVCWQHHE